MDLVDEQHIAVLEVGEDGGEVVAGPDVGLNPAAISVATIWASVVLPSPGGPLNSRWSTGSERRLAPSINSANCSFTRS